jgi:phage gp36-like protein
MSYSTPTAFYKRIGETLQYQLTAETSDTPDDTVAQGILDAASLDVNIRVGNRYATPVLAPADQVARLAALEEQIAHWLLFVRKGFSEDDPAAKAAFSQADRAYKILDSIAKGGEGGIDLVGAAPRLVVTTGTQGIGWQSNVPVYTKDNYRFF